MSGTTKAYRWMINYGKSEGQFGIQEADADIAAGSWYEVNDFKPTEIEKTYRTNQNRINGTRGKTLRQLKGRSGKLARTSDASVEVITNLLLQGLGNFSVSGSGDPYTLTIKHPSVCTLYPISKSYVEGVVCNGLTSGYKLYKGAVVSKITIEGGGGQDEIKLTYEYMTDGSETTKASFTFTTTPAVLNYLIGAHLNFKLYPNGGGPIDITTDILSWKITYDFAPQPRKTGSSSSSVLVPKYKYGKDTPKLDVEFVYCGDKSGTVYGYFDNDTLLTLQITLDAGVTPARSVSLLMNQCYITATEGEDDLEPTLNCKVDTIDVIADSGPAVWTCKAGSNSWLVASP
ncbi:MAG TPA: hypothetical protein VJ464_15840 [Blastocatellia bacterium]|nr:hypothetical protein [Blastocatellia bacterium]